MQEEINGIWLLDNAPSEFLKILDILGYNAVERYCIKNSKVKIHSTYKEPKLMLTIKKSVYKKTKEYCLNAEPIFYVDENKNNVIETAKWLNDKTIQIKTIFPEKKITIIDIKELISSEICLQKIILIQMDQDPIEVEVKYIKSDKDNKK